MALNKSTVNIPFGQGLDTLTDPKQISIGNFLKLQNTIFNKGKLLQKRNGYKPLATLSGATTIATYNESLVAIGSSFQSYSPDTGQIINNGFVQPITLKTQSLVRRATSQNTVDIAVTSSGLSCITWLDQDGASYYQVSDSNTGQTLIPAVALPSTATMSRVYILGQYFVITFMATVSGAPHLRYIAIPISNPSNPGGAVDIATTIPSITTAYDAITANNNLYVSWNANDGGGAIRTIYLTSTLVLSSVVVIASESANLISVTADISGSSAVIWVSFYDSGGNTIKTAAYSQSLVVVLTKHTAASSITINELTSSATGNVNTIWYEVANTYSYTPNAKTDYIAKNTVTVTGTVGTAATILRSVGLASKAFNLGTKAYALSTYGQTFQPTYFLIDSSGNIIAKLAYSNGGGYLANQILPNVSINGTVANIGYLFKDLLAAVNKTQGVANVAGVYSQTGINLASFDFDSIMSTANIASDLHLGGGFVWMYDGVKPVEHGFHVWPEDITVTTSGSGGLITAQQYFYQVTYEWTDGMGNIHRSAPSVPVTVTTSGATSSNTINIPYLRLTYKTTNKVRIVIYRWSAAQQNYYRVTSITSPTLNNPASDSVAYVDTLADSSILGNDLIYTTGGVIENIAAPAASDMTLFKSRVFLIDSEDRNLLWFSKQVPEATPVEFSDLFTEFIAPTTGAKGDTGPMECITVMDDKLIIFKSNAIYYITGTGPDNAGANNDFSEPIFITSSVGCSNPRSIVFMPEGLMFQSNQGIWLLNRNLQTSYIGAPVAGFNDLVVTSAVSVPGTNQVRFTLNNKATLLYDYFYAQWSSFFNLAALSSTIFQGLHTYLNASGKLLQETPGQFLDDSAPVLMSFTTGWINVGGLQEFQRAYFFYLLGQYISPHKLTVQIAYDYNDSPSQSTVITPLNTSNTYGSESLYGGGVYGGSLSLEQWRVFLDQQKCQAFQITITESFDPSQGFPAGGGFTLSGIDLVVGVKDGKPRLSARQQTG